jgi:large subunit ribosomal protein L13
MKTFQPKAKEVERSWHLIDAKGEILGRLATRIATLLTGKHKGTYSTHMDMGDFVVVINSEKIEVTGKKDQQKMYYRHSGYPQGFKKRTFQQMMDTHPERILEHAVNGMVPDNKLKSDRMLRLKLVVGDKNPYVKQLNLETTEKEEKE